MQKPRQTPRNRRYFDLHVEPVMWRALIEPDRQRREELLRVIAQRMHYSRRKTMRMMRTYSKELTRRMQRTCD